MAGGTRRRTVGDGDEARAGRAAGYAAAAPGLPAAAAASRHAQLRRAGSLSALQSRPRRGARVQRALRARVSPERHGDRAEDALLLDTRPARTSRRRLTS